MYSSNDKEKARALRLSGMSYTDILKKVGVKSKGTLSEWFKDLEITPEAKELLKSNIDRATERKLLAFNEARSRKIRWENKIARKDGAARVGNITHRDLLISGVALYWGEGSKSERTNKYKVLGFSNSDPEMIRVFLRFVREILEVHDQKIYAAIHMYEREKVKQTRAFWASCTGLSESRFKVSYQVSRAGKGIRNTLPYGTLNLRVNNRIVFHHVMGMIEGMYGKSR